MSSIWTWLFIFWAVVMTFFLTVGGYFMFRKFLKALPMGSGKSKIDMQNELLEQARGMWSDESLAFLEKLVSPVPQAFRDLARHTIAAGICEVALGEKAVAITPDHCLRGYILSTPRRDHRSLIKFLQENNIDYTAHEDILKK